MEPQNSKKFEENRKVVLEKLSLCPTPKEKYSLLMEMGESLPPYPPEKKTPPHLVPGCQSLLYLYTYLEGNTVHFCATADAAISKGLAAILLATYGGLSPKEVLQHPPTFLQETGVVASLSPNRSNGLAQIYLRMQKDVIGLFRTNARP